MAPESAQASSWNDYRDSTVARIAACGPVHLGKPAKDCESVVEEDENRTKRRLDRNICMNKTMQRHARMLLKIS